MPHDFLRFIANGTSARKLRDLSACSINHYATLGFTDTHHGFQSVADRGLARVDSSGPIDTESQAMIDI
jgi:hypothetical protein